MIKYVFSFLCNVMHIAFYSFECKRRDDCRMLKSAGLWLRFNWRIFFAGLPHVLHNPKCPNLFRSYNRASPTRIPKGAFDQYVFNHSSISQLLLHDLLTEKRNSRRTPGFTALNGPLWRTECVSCEENQCYEISSRGP